MSEVVRLTGLRAEGRHGASPGERDAAQPFVVDLEVEVEATGDELGRTADYREIAAVARRVIEVESHALLETVARRIVAQVAEVPGVVGARAVVHKPEAASRLGVADISAEAGAAAESPE